MASASREIATQGHDSEGSEQGEPVFDPSEHPACQIIPAYYEACGHEVTNKFCQSETSRMWRAQSRQTMWRPERFCNSRCFFVKETLTIYTRVQCEFCTAKLTNIQPLGNVEIADHPEEMSAEDIAARTVEAYQRRGKELTRVNMQLSERDMERLEHARAIAAGPAQRAAKRERDRRRAWIADVEQQRRLDDQAHVPIDQRCYYFGLDESVLLPHYYFPPGETDTCGMCRTNMERTDDIRHFITCRHAFHYACIRDWFKINSTIRAREIAANLTSNRPRRESRLNLTNPNGSRVCPRCRIAYDVQEMPDFADPPGYDERVDGVDAYPSSSTGGSSSMDASSSRMA